VEQAVSNQPARRSQPAIMRVQDVVDFLKLPSVQTVDSWIRKGVGPPYYWAGHQIRYRRTEVLKWFVERTGPGHMHAVTVNVAGRSLCGTSRK
jgi:hypothetical protein